MAPPRRLPAPANDNPAPVRERLKRYAFLAVIAAMAVSLVLAEGG
jgi:hypothetical protein